MFVSVDMCFAANFVLTLVVITESFTKWVESVAVP